MIERFTIADYPTDIQDNQTGKKYPCSSYSTHMQGICDLLNEQQNTINTYQKENEQLKNQLNYQQIMEKARIQSAIQNERTNLGKNALKQLLMEIE